MKLASRLGLVGLWLSLLTAVSWADIFQWEYIDPANPALGKRQSATLAPGGAGVTAIPGANLASRNLTMAYLIGADLQESRANDVVLVDADLSGADLARSIFSNANLTGAVLANANVRGTGFSGAIGLTAEQFYSTASYQAGDLTGVYLGGDPYGDGRSFAGWNFARQNLTNAALTYGNFTEANFIQANLTGAVLFANLTRADLGQAILTKANLAFATLTGANLSDAEVRGANFLGTVSRGFTAAQLYSTASYQARDLSGINLGGTFGVGGQEDHSGWSFVGQNLSDSYFGNTILTDADFTGANLTGADFQQAVMTNVDLSQANLRDTSFSRGTLTNAILREADLSSTHFTFATLSGMDITGAYVRGADFSRTNDFGGTGITLGQLYSTASYQARDLSQINLTGNHLNGAQFARLDFSKAWFSSASLVDADFRQTNLTGASLDGAQLTDADFSGTEIQGASFSVFGFQGAGSGLTPAQIYSTASYQAGRLSGIDLSGNSLAAANFAGHDLANANFGEAELSNANLSQANLTNANFGGANLSFANLTDAEVRGAKLYRDYLGKGGITLQQIYSTASYKSRDLAGVWLSGDFSGGDFTEQSLTVAMFSGALLTAANFSRANLVKASFSGATLIDANFSGAHIGGANFSATTSKGFTAAQLYSTASYQVGDLKGVIFGNPSTTVARNDLTDWNFAGQDLTGANFAGAILTGADFNGARVTGANFWRVFDNNAREYMGGLSATQLYSTASYREQNLAGIQLRNYDLSGWNFAGQNLTNATLTSTLTGADFSAADLRGAGTTSRAAAITANMIDPAGNIHGLDLSNGQTLVIRDFDGDPNRATPLAPIAILVEQHFNIEAGGTLRIMFEDDAWNSIVSFAPDIPVSRGGTLELLFSDGTDPGVQVGRTFKLFNWTGVQPIGGFAVASPYRWNWSNLYTTGEVTLLAVPEPTAFPLAALGILGLIHHLRMRKP